MGDGNDDAVTTIELPIREIEGEVVMKNIPLSTLPNFHGLTSKVLNTSSSNLIFFVEAMITPLMLRS